MKCEHPNCTGSHDLRKRANMCPRTRQDERERHARWAAANPMKDMLAHVRDNAHRRERPSETTESDRA